MVLMSTMNGIPHFGSHTNLDDFAEKAPTNRPAPLGRGPGVYHEPGRDVIDAELRLQGYLQGHGRSLVQAWHGLTGLTRTAPSR